MKIIQVNSNVFKAFKAESQKNFDGGGNLLQTMAFALGYETNGIFKISELVFPSQDCEIDLVRETGNCIHTFFKILRDTSAINMQFDCILFNSTKARSKNI